MTDRIDILFPVGRLVSGSMSKGQTTDAEGRPLTTKSGPNAGQPRTDYFFAVAIPKGQEQSWQQTDWGRQMLALAQKAFPNGQWQAPTFAWKVHDGDSQVPNRRGNKPCDREGWKGNWVVNFSSGFPPRTFDAKGQNAIDPEGVKLGYFVQVYGSVVGNGSANQPGLFVNHSLVALAGYGEEIVIGPNAASVGFGTGPTPVGMTAAPVGGMTPMQAATTAAPAVPNVPTVPQAAPAPVPTAPYTGAMQAPAVPQTALAAPAVPPAPQAPVASPAHQMLPAAQGIPYDAYKAQGWTDEQLIANGMMAA